MERKAETYLKISDQKLISNRLFLIYNAVYGLGPITSAELHKHLTDNGMPLRLNAVSPRFSELAKLGIIQRIPKKRLCKVTQRLVTEWDVTNELPGKAPARMVPAHKKLDQLRSVLKPVALELNRPENINLPGSVPLSVPLSVLRETVMILMH